MISSADITSHRRIQAEMLDQLPPDHPAAARSRRDLRRINFIMGSAPILCRAIAGAGAGAGPGQGQGRLLELGAGDGHLSARVAERLEATGVSAHLTLVDQADLVDDATKARFRRLGWNLEVARADALQWAATCRDCFDVAFANLFIHHLGDEAIATLFRCLSERVDAFVACEPRRGRLPLFGSRLLALTGANAVTRNDAVLSVRAGFRGRELSALWPAGPAWQLEERSAGLFSHLFVARRTGRE